MWIIIRVLIAIVILFLVQFYFSKKIKTTVLTTFPSLTEKKYRLIIRSFLIWLNLYPAFLIVGAIYAAITNQRVYFPENTFIDYLVLYPFWLLLLLVGQVSLIFLLLDILKIAFFPLYKKYKQKLFRLQINFHFLIIIFFIVYIPARVIYDYNTVLVSKVTLKKNNLPESLNGFKITFISDIQADKYTDKKRLSNYITKVNETNPDLVLIAGDVITSSPDYIQTAAEFIGKIKSKYGIYSCVGDHDNWAYRQDTKRSLREIKSALMHYNIEMVDNDIRTITVDSSSIGLTIITHTYVESIPQILLDSLSKENKADVKIFLTHQPQEFLIESAERNKYDLFLAGHTHGGQITFLFPFIQLSPTLIETTYIRGNFYFGKMLMIISSGLGMSLAPVRYNSTPEIVSIVLI